MGLGRADGLGLWGGGEGCPLFLDRAGGEEFGSVGGWETGVDVGEDAVGDGLFVEVEPVVGGGYDGVDHAWVVVLPEKPLGRAIDKDGVGCRMGGERGLEDRPVEAGVDAEDGAVGEAIERGDPGVDLSEIFRGRGGEAFEGEGGDEVLGFDGFVSAGVGDGGLADRADGEGVDDLAAGVVDDRRGQRVGRTGRRWRLPSRRRGSPRGRP